MVDGSRLQKCGVRNQHFLKPQLSKKQNMDRNGAQLPNLKALPDGSLPSVRTLLPKESTMFQDSMTTWGSNIQTHEPMKTIYIQTTT